MDYRTVIPEEHLKKVSAGIIRRYRKDAGDQECSELMEAFLILARYLTNFFTDHRYVEIKCTDPEFRFLGTVATTYRETVETWSELLSLGDPPVIRYNVKPTTEFSTICNEIAVYLNNKAAELDRTPVRTLGIDIETYSGNDISDGVLKMDIVQSLNAREALADTLHGDNGFIHLLTHLSFLGFQLGNTVFMFRVLLGILYHYCLFLSIRSISILYVFAEIRTFSERIPIPHGIFCLFCLPGKHNFSLHNPV